MDLTRTIKRNDNCAFQEADGKAIIMLAENSNIFTINQMGTEIWNLLETPKTLQEVVETLQKKYNDDDKEVVKNDALEFLAHCFRDKIFEFAD